MKPFRGIPRLVERKPSLTSVAHSAAGLFYPPRCVACGVFDVDLCDACTAKMIPATGSGHCGNCSAPWTGDGYCPTCFGWDALDGARAAFDMAGPARRVVHALKYTGVRGMAPRMAAHMAPHRGAAALDLALAIPLHRRRQNERGFNQADLLLRHLGWPAGEGHLRRIRKTRSQVGLHEEERRRNVAGAFTYEGPDLSGATVALIDDVVTTGATANECARLLRDHGARRVLAVSFARAGSLAD